MKLHDARRGAYLFRSCVIARSHEIMRRAHAFGKQIQFQPCINICVQQVDVALLCACSPSENIELNNALSCANLSMSNHDDVDSNNNNDFVPIVARLHFIYITHVLHLSLFGSRRTEVDPSHNFSSLNSRLSPHCSVNV